MLCTVCNTKDNEAVVIVIGLSLCLSHYKTAGILLNGRMKSHMNDFTSFELLKSLLEIVYA